MLKHHKKLRELSINPKTGNVDMRKLRSKAFKEEFLKIIVHDLKEEDLVNYLPLIGESSKR